MNRTGLSNALKLWRLGLSIFPVPRPDERYDGKTPEIRWSEFQQRRPTEEEVRRWFTWPLNIAVVTGRISGVVVIDLDSFQAICWAKRVLPYTPWQTRTPRGFHLWYRHSGILVRNQARLDTHPDGRLEIDVRGDGGYAIGPGSVHKTGCVYEFAGDWSVPRDGLPRFWPGWVVRPQKASPKRPPTRPIGDIAERARRYLAAIPPPEIGRGSDAATLYAACRLVRGFQISESQAVDLLWEWAGGRDGWTREWIVRKVRNARAYGSEPEGALR